MPHSRILDKVIGPSMRFRTSLLTNIRWACLLCLIRREAHAEGTLADSYVGCYQLGNLVPVAGSSSRTIESCVATCQSNSRTYAALQGGNTCSCLDAVDTSYPSNDCNSTCNGNRLELCGGLGRLYSIYTVCPIGLYGFGCNLACHCDQQIPCDRTSGNCPNNKCYGNWTGTSCSDINTSSTYLGCYRDRFDNRSLPQRVADGQVNCSLNCRKNNNIYFGLEFFRECYCGNNSDSSKRINESYCNTPCTDNPNVICGGADAISLYSVCPSGNYGDNCYAQCNCANNERCSYANGACPSGACKPGWAGPSCSVRDCQRNNGDCFANRTCLQLNLKYASVTRCMCPSGYQRDNLWDFCTDKDECSNGESKCDDDSTDCLNTVGGYNCICKPGFQSLDVSTCSDKDECRNGESKCDADSTDCLNTVGGYNCICKPGFQSLNVSTSCSDIDECLVGKDMCNNQTTTCENTFGSYRCACLNGLQKNTDITCSSESTLYFSLGSIIGAVVGTAAGVTVLFLIIGAIVFMRRRRRRESQQQRCSDGGTEDSNHIQDYEMKLDSYETLRASRIEGEASYESLENTIAQTDNTVNHQ